MHTGIRAPRTVQMNMLLRNSPKHIYNFALNGWFFRLNLPAVKICSVVGNREFEIAHSMEEVSNLQSAAHKAAAGLYRSAAFAAKWAIFGFIARNRQIQQCLRLDRKFDFAPATINQRSGCNDATSRFFNNVDRFQSRATCGPNVFNHKHALARLQLKSAAQTHIPARIALGKHCRRSAPHRTSWFRKSASHFLPDDEASHRR